MGYVLSILLNLLMGYIFVTSSFHLTNIVAVAYIVLILIGMLTTACIWICGINPSFKAEPKVIATYIRLLHPPIPEKVVGWCLFVLTVLMMLACQFQALVVFYILTTLAIDGMIYIIKEQNVHGW